MKDNKQNQSTMMKVIGLVLIAIIALSGVLLLGFNDSNNDQSTEVTQSIVVSEDGTQVNYEGVSDQSALTLLKQGADVGTEEFSGLGEYVVSINGLAADSTSNYWAFYVNGEAAQVGAGDFITEDGDIVEWRLEYVSNFAE